MLGQDRIGLVWLGLVCITATTVDKERIKYKQSIR